MHTRGCLVMCAMLLAVLGAAGFRDPYRPRAVRIECKEGVYSLFPNGTQFVTRHVAGGSSGLLLRDGDLISGETTEFLIPYRDEDGALLRLEISQWCTRLGGRIVGLSVGSGSGDSARLWLAGASHRDLSRVRGLMVQDSLEASDLRALGRLAAINPKLALSMEEGSKVGPILALFRPTALAGPWSAEDIRANLPRLAELEDVVLTKPDSAKFGVLPMLPGLRRLSISLWRPDDSGPLPAGLNALRTLRVVFDSNMSSDWLRVPPRYLEELAIGSIDSVEIPSPAQLPGLRSLRLAGDYSSRDIAALSGFTKLRWASVPPGSTQDQFATFVSSHPDLEVLEIVSADSVTSLAPLRELKKLSGLVLIGQHGDLGVLRELGSLRFVGLDGDSASVRPGQLAALRSALPDALVVAVEPLCLGSGWILFLVPAMATGALLARRRRPGPGAAFVA